MRPASFRREPVFLKSEKTMSRMTTLALARDALDLPTIVLTLCAASARRATGAMDCIDQCEQLLLLRRIMENDLFLLSAHI